MKFFERFLPKFITDNIVIYNLTTIVLCIIIFILLFYILGVLSVFISFLICQIFERFYGSLEMASMAVVLLSVVVSVIMNFVFCLVILINNIKWK